MILKVKKLFSISGSSFSLKISNEAGEMTQQAKVPAVLP